MGVNVSNYLENLNKLLPKRRMHIRTNNPEWFTPEVLNSISRKNRNFVRAKINPEIRSLE